MLSAKADAKEAAELPEGFCNAGALDRGETISNDNNATTEDVTQPQSTAVSDDNSDEMSTIEPRFSNISVKQEPMEESVDIGVSDDNIDKDSTAEYISGEPSFAEMDTEAGNAQVKEAGYDNVQVQLVEVSDDEDLFDVKKDHGILTLEEHLGLDENNQSEEQLKKMVLYQYLIEADPKSLGTSELVTDTKNEKVELRSCEQTPVHSGDEEESEESSDGYKEYDTDTSEVETPEKRASTESSPVEPVLDQQPKPGRKPNQPRKKGHGQDKNSLSAKTRERLEKSKAVTEKWLNDLKLPENVSLTQKVTLRIGDLNKYLTCGICKGYLYEASTITECMHTFCKNCIVRHCMEVSLHCPVCLILIHPTDPFVNIRLDRMIQDIVYKILPSVAQTEMRRIEEYYAEHPEVEQKTVLARPKSPKVSPREKEEKPPVKMVSLVLEQEGDAILTKILEKKYVRVAGTATISNVQTFLKAKLNLALTSKVELYCCGDMLEDLSFTLVQLQNKFFPGEDVLMLVQYRVVDT